MRRFFAVLVVAACAGVSARLWSEALTPTAAQFVEPFSAPSGLSAAPQIVVVAAAEPPAAHHAPKVVGKTATKGTASRGTPIASVTPAHTPAAPAAHTPAKPVTTPQPPKVTPPVVTPAPPAAPAPTPAPAPNPPAAAVPIAPVVQPVPPPVQQPAPANSKPGNGYGDKNHSHTGPGGPKG